MEAAQEQHGDIGYWNRVTDQNYEDGRYYKTIPEPPCVNVVDFTGYDGPLDENGFPVGLMDEIAQNAKEEGRDPNEPQIIFKRNAPPDDPETPPAYQLELEKTYDNDDLFYAVEYCVKSGFVETLFSKDTYRIPISRITPDGHRFLENIRSDTNWEKVKSVAKKAGSFSADVIIEIAKNVAVEAAKHFLTNT